MVNLGMWGCECAASFKWVNYRQYHLSRDGNSVNGRGHSSLSLFLFQQPAALIRLFTDDMVDLKVELN